MDKTVYRIYPNGEVIALFPQLAATLNGWLCTSYMHVGQHSAANCDVVVRRTKLATPAEYKELHAELEKIGYNQKLAKRCTRRDFEIRKAQYK